MNLTDYKAETLDAPHAGIGHYISRADYDTAFYFESQIPSTVPVSPAGYPLIYAYQTPNIASNCPSVRHDLLSTHQQQGIGFSYRVGLSFQALNPASYGGGWSYPLTLSGSWTCEVYDTAVYPIPAGARLLFQQTVTATLTINSGTASGVSYTITSYSYSEVLNTTVVNGVSVNSTTVLNTLDNGNTAESDSGTGTLGGTANSLWSRTFQSAPYVMDMPANCMVKMTYNFPPLVNYTRPGTGVNGILANVNLAGGAPAPVRDSCIPSLRGEQPFCAALISQGEELLTAVRVPTGLGDVTTPGQVLDSSSNVQLFAFPGQSATARTARAQLTACNVPTLCQDDRGRVGLLVASNAQRGGADVYGYSFWLGDGAGASLNLQSGSVASSSSAYGRNGYSGRVAYLRPNMLMSLTYIPPSGSLGQTLNFLHYANEENLSGAVEVQRGVGGALIANWTDGSRPVSDQWYLWQLNVNNGLDLFCSNGYDRTYYAASVIKDYLYGGNPWQNFLGTGITIWDRTQYRNPHISGGRGGDMFGVATKNSTWPNEIWFRYSKDGIDWTKAPVLVGTLGTAVGGTVYNCGLYRAAQVYQLRDGRLLITNGYDRIWISTTGGQDWLPS